MTQQRYDAVLFDAAGTLLYVHPDAGTIYADEARRFEVDVSLDALNTAFRDVFAARRPATTPESLTTSEAIERDWWRGTVEAVFASASKLDAFGDRFDEFFHGLFERFAEPDAWRFYDDVVPTMDALAAMDLKLGVVSNWDARLHRLIDAMDRRHHFDIILTSAEAGRRKPDPLPFVLACDRLGVTPNRALYVGDSYDDDIAGAEGAGLNAVLIDRKGKKTREGIICTLARLPEILEGN